MEDILRKLLSHDSDLVNEGTLLLKQSANQPQFVKELVNILINHQEVEYRQYCCIILKKRFSQNKWLATDLPTRTEFKFALLHIYMKESTKAVKKCVAHLIGTILKHEHLNWNELQELLQTTIMGEDNDQKEAGYFLLITLAEICPEEMQMKAQYFLSHFNWAMDNLKDKASPVGYFIMLYMTHMIHLLSVNKQYTKMYNELIPKTYQIVFALAEKRPDRAAEVLDLYYELTNDKALTSFLVPKMNDLVHVCLDLTVKSKSEDLQIKALNYIATLAAIKGKQLMKDGLINKILNVVFAIMKESPMDDEDEQYFSSDSSEDTLMSCACETLDTIALNTDSKKLMNPLLELVKPALDSANPYERKAAYLALGIISQGCEHYIRNRIMDTFVQTVYKGVNDQYPVVRNAALFALGQMGEHLQPEISKNALEIMPLLISQLDVLGEAGKSGERLGQRVDRLFFAIERFCETLESSLIHFLDKLLPRLLMFSNSPFHTHIREAGMGAIGTVASSVENAITPYFNDIMQVLNIYLVPQTNPEYTALQVEALDTLGILARHVGHNEFSPLALDSVKLGLELIASTDDPDVRKSSYGLFASVSNVLKEVMGPYLQNIIPIILNSIKNEQAFIVHDRDDATAAFPLFENDDEYDENEGVGDDDDDDLDNLTVENDFVEEKEEACLALKELAMNTGETFAPYLESSIEEVYKLLNFPSMDVRKAALEAEAQFCISFVQIMYNASQGDNKLAIVIMEKLIVKTMEIIKFDLSKEIALTGLECLQTMLKQIGPQIGCVPSLKESIIAVIKTVFNSKTESQALAEEEDDDEATESEVIDAAADIIPLLAKAMTQEEFSSIFAEFLPFIRNRILHAENDGDDDDDDEEVGSKGNAIGILSQCMEGLGLHIGQYVSGLLPYLLALTKDSETNARNNALYTIGEMALHGKEHMYQQYPTILNALSQVLATEEKPKVIDNACGVIARMIITNVELVPLQQVFHVFVTHLPLKEDFSEDVWVLRAINHVIKVAPEIVRPDVCHILQSADFTLSSHAPDDECKQELLETFRLLVSHFPDVSGVAITQLNSNVLEFLRKFGIIPN